MAITSTGDPDAIATGILLARFRFGEYKGTANQKKKGDESDETPLEVSLLSDDREVKAAVDRARIIADGQNFARTIAC